MSSSIGTNVVADDNEMYQLIQGILNTWERLLQDKDNDIYKKMIKDLGDYVGNKGTLVYAVVPQKFIKDIEAQLQKEHISYMLLPTETGDMGIAVKDKDKDRFYEIQDNVMSLSTDYYAELTDPYKFLDFCKGNPRMKNLDVPVFEFSSNEARLMAQINMNQRGVLPVYDDRNQKVYTVPDKLFDRDGDLVDAIFSTGADFARCEMDEDYKETKFAQVRYDRDTTNQFIQNFRNGKSCYLADIYNGSGIDLNIDYNGDISVIENGVKNVIITAEEAKHVDNTVLYAQLSKYTSKINNMSIMNEAAFNYTKLNKSGMTIEDKDKQKIKNDLIQKDNRLILRPEQEKTVAKAYSEMGKDLDTIFSVTLAQANKDVMEMRNVKYKTQEELMRAKKNRVIDILQTKGNSVIEDFLKNPITILDDENNEISEIISVADKKELINKIIDSVDDIIGNSSTELNMKLVKQKELEEELNRQAEFNREKQNEKENDREDEEPEHNR